MAKGMIYPKGLPKPLSPIYPNGRPGNFWACMYFNSLPPLDTQPEPTETVPYWIKEPPLAQQQSVVRSEGNWWDSE